VLPGLLGMAVKSMHENNAIYLSPYASTVELNR
jgi:hypothetical protein